MNCSSCSGVRALVEIVEVVEIGRGENAGGPQGVDETVDGLKAGQIVAPQVGSVQLGELAVDSADHEQHAIDAMAVQKREDAGPDLRIGELAGKAGTDQE